MEREMARKRHKPEEIVAKLRQVDVLTAQGQSIAEAVRTIVSAVPLAPLLERSERRCLKPLRAWTHDDFRAYA